MAESPSIGKQFVEKTEAMSEEGSLGRTFVDKVEEQEESKAGAAGAAGAGDAGAGGAEGGILASMANTMKRRSVLMKEGLSRLSQRASQVAQELGQELSSVATEVAKESSEAARSAWDAVFSGVSGAYVTHPDLVAAVQGVQVEHIMRPQGEFQLVKLGGNAKVADLLEKMEEHHLHAVPIEGAPGRWLGDVDALDLVTFCTVKFSKVSLDAWTTFQNEAEFKNQPLQHLVDISNRNRMLAVHPSNEILSIIKAFRDQDVHRVYVMNEKREILDVVSHNDLAQVLVKVECPLKQWKIGDKVRSALVFSCHSSELLISALKLMFDRNVNGIAVVDDSGKAVGNISAVDLTKLTPGDMISQLYKPLSSFLGLNLPNANTKVVTLTPSSTFDEALREMVHHHVHRLYVVDDSDIPTAVITLRDILRCFVAAK